MPITDPIGDMLTRLRNAIMAKHEAVRIPASRMKVQLARILAEEGFVEGYEVLKGEGPRSTIKVFLHYRSRGEPAISKLKRVSKPGLRVFVGKKEIPRYYGGLGVAIMSTSEGIMTGKQAWRKGLGGELLCYVV